MRLEFNEDLIWSSDWNGEEIGYPEMDVVGLYSLRVNPDVYFYIDIENERVLEAFYMCEECNI